MCRTTERVAHDGLVFTVMELSDVYARAAEFDLIHNHTDYVAFPLARQCATPTLTATRGRLDLPEVQCLYRRFADQRRAARHPAAREMDRHGPQRHRP